MLFSTLYAVAQAEVPEAEQGEGYGMPALTYRGKPLLSLTVAKKHLSAVPFSSEVVASLSPDLGSYQITKGTIHFQAQAPLTPSLLRRLVELRRVEIDAATT